MSNRRTVRTPIAFVVLAACLTLGLAACSTSAATRTGSLGTLSGSSTPTGAGTPGATTPGPGTTTPAANPTTKKPVTPPAPVIPLTCAQLKSASVGTSAISYNGYHDSIPLGGGVWSGEDGNTVTLQAPCGVGDLTGDGVAEAVGVVALTSGGTGDFYTLVVWKNSRSQPVFTALSDLGDRNPVQTITISGGKATVVYLTRTDDAPMAEVNIQRTATYVLSGHHFTESGHVDEPYTEH